MGTFPPLNNASLEATNILNRQTGLSSGWANFTWQHQELILVLYVMVAIVGAVGNTLVLVVFVSKSQLRESPTNIFIINLAIADVTTSVLIIPFKVVTYPIPSGIFGEILCRAFISQYFLWSSGGASAYTLFWVTMERYIAIVHPFKYDSTITVSKAVFMCVSAWVLALSLESYEFVTYSYRDHTCAFEVLFITRFLIICEGAIILAINFVMLTVYSRIAYVLRMNIQKMKHEGIPMADPRQFETILAKKRVAKLMFIVLGAYFTCWAGVGVCNVWTSVWPGVYSTVGGEIAMLMAIANSCCNPLIYVFKSKVFRKTLKKMFLKRPHMEY